MHGPVGSRMCRSNDGQWTWKSWSIPAMEYRNCPHLMFKQRRNQFLVHMHTILWESFVNTLPLKVAFKFDTTLTDSVWFESMTIEHTSWSMWLQVSWSGQAAEKLCPFSSWGRGSAPCIGRFHLARSDAAMFPNVMGYNYRLILLETNSPPYLLLMLLHQASDSLIVLRIVPFHYENIGCFTPRRLPGSPMKSPNSNNEASHRQDVHSAIRAEEIKIRCQN